MDLLIIKLVAEWRGLNITDKFSIGPNQHCHNACLFKICLCSTKLNIYFHRPEFRQGWEHEQLVEQLLCRAVWGSIEMHGGTVRQIQLETCRRTKCKLNNGNNMNFRKQTIKTDILTYVYTYSTCRMCLLWVPSKHFHCPKKFFLK